MSNDLDGDLELENLRNELLKGMNKKCQNSKKKTEEKSSEDDELELLRLQALKTKHDKTENLNKKIEKYGYEEEWESLDGSKKSSENDASEIQSRRFQDEFKNKYQRYRDRCTRIMSNEAYEPDMISYNLKETLNNLDLRRLLKEKLEESESTKDQSNTDLILQQLDHAYRPITEPISLTKNDFYVNSNYRSKIAYHRDQSKNGETKYWKNNSNNSKDKTNEDKNYIIHDTDASLDDEEDDFQPNKKLRSIVQVINTTNKDESNNSTNHYHSSYRSRRRYD
ncbi:hypothetical protein BpHYR1_042117, partial [Brachionus plicatilis]